ncbi:PAS domain S-box protein [Verrucomicrobiota bacterium]
MAQKGEKAGKKKPVRRISAASARQLSALSDEQSELLSDIILHSPVGTAVCGVNGEILFANQAMSDIFKYPVDKFADIPEWATAIFPDPARCKEVLAAWAENVKLPEPPDREFPVTRKDGKQRWVHFHMAHAPESRIIVTARDITKRRRTESALRRTQFAIDRADSPVFWVDKQARIVQANDATCKALGYPRKELLSLTVHDIAPEYPEKSWASHWKKTRKRRYATIETIHRRKNGTTFPVEIHVNYQEFEGKEYHCDFVHDITERKQAEGIVKNANEELKAAHKYLKESEGRFRQLASAAFEAIAIHDDGMLMMANDQFFRMFGYKPDELLNKNIITTTIAPEARGHIKKQIAAGRLGPYESTGLRKDGSTFPIEIRVRVIKQHGRKVRVGAIVDITDRKKAESELHETSRLLKGILGNISVLAFSFDKDGIFTESLGDGLKRLQLKPRQAVGMNAFDMYPQLTKELRSAQKGNKVSFDAEGVLDGKRWCFNTHIFPDPDNPGGVVGFALDVTEERQAQDELRRLAAAVNSAAESIVITDVAGAIVYINPYFEKMTGYKRKEVLGKNPKVLSSGKQDEKFYKDMWDKILAGKVWRGHFTNRKKDGTLFEEQAVISPVKDHTGQVVNFVAVKRDVTHEHFLQSQIRRSQKMAAIGQLAHKVAHDFTNVLVTIQGNAELIKMDTLDIPKVGPYLNDILTATNRISSLTAELLAFAHPSKPMLRAVRLDKALLGVEEILRRTMPKNIDFTFKVLGKKLRANMDPTQIEQAVMHLAINAIEAMPEGGGLTIEAKAAGLSAAESSRLQAGMSKSDMHRGDFALFTVTDTGRGMTHETESHIFEPFYTTKQNKQNPGLGLTTVYSIVEGHNGHVKVDSEPGRGSTFSIYLPMA